jgi:hypothetical protein
MSIVITGGTGFIGRALCQTFVQLGQPITLLTRRPAEIARLFASPLVTAVEWNGRDPGSWERCLADADAVINLAGAPIAEGRWTRARKQMLFDSRIMATRRVVDAIARRGSRPCTLINASGVGYYGPSDDRILDEQAAAGGGFLAELSAAWEAEALRAREFGARVVVMRTGMVLDHDGGALPMMLLPFRLFLGGPILPGTQWVSWIHRRDLVGLIGWALRTWEISGPINAVAPTPVTMKTFCETLGRVLRRPSWLPVPGLALRLGLGELGTLMTTGQRVVPARAFASGYVFYYPELERALRATLGREGSVAALTSDDHRALSNPGRIR